MATGNGELHSLQPSAGLQQTKGFFCVRSTPQEINHGQVLATSVSNVFQEAVEQACIREREAILGIEDIKRFHVDLF